MSLSVQQANFLIPSEILKDLRAMVPRGEQSAVVSEALRRELKRRKLATAIGECFGGWGIRADLGPTRAFVRHARKERRF